MIGEKLKAAGIPLLIIIVASAVAAVMISSKEPPEQLEEEEKPFLVDAITARAQDLNFTVRSQGTVMPKIQTVLAAQVNGRVMRVSPAFIEGGIFAKGDLLVLLEQDDYITDLKAAEAELARAQASLEEEQARGKVAAEEWRTVSSSTAPDLGLRKPQLAQEMANVRAAQARMERAQRNLDRTQIRAPYDGIMKSQEVDVGQFVSVGQQLGRIYATDVAEVRMPLADSDLAYLSLPHYPVEQGAKVMLTGKVAGNESTWRGNLTRNEGILDSQRRVIYAVAEIEDPYLRLPGASGIPLRFGQFVTAEITGDQRQDMIVLPRSVLRLDGTLLVVSNERELEIRSVTLARKDESYIYLDSGVESGELVAVTKVPNPYEGMPVRLATDLPAPNDTPSGQKVVAVSGGEK